MKEINVYIKYPWKVYDSSYYKSLVDYPPENIKYLNNLSQKGVIVNGKKFNLINKYYKIYSILKTIILGRNIICQLKFFKADTVTITSLIFLAFGGSLISKESF